MYPASGSAAGTDGLYKIGFFNYTKRDVVLTMKDKTVTLPAESYLHANLPADVYLEVRGPTARRRPCPATPARLDVPDPESRTQETESKRQQAKGH